MRQESGATRRIRSEKARMRKYEGRKNAPTRQKSLKSTSSPRRIVPLGPGTTKADIPGIRATGWKPKDLFGRPEWIINFGPGTTKRDLEKIEDQQKKLIRWKGVF